MTREGAPRPARWRYRRRAPSYPRAPTPYPVAVRGARRLRCSRDAGTQRLSRRQCLPAQQRLPSLRLGRCVRDAPFCCAARRASQHRAHAQPGCRRSRDHAPSRRLSRAMDDHRAAYTVARGRAAGADTRSRVPGALVASRYQRARSPAPRRMGRRSRAQRAQHAGARRGRRVERQAVVYLTGPIIGGSRRAHRVGSGRRDAASFEANLSASEQLRLIIIGATVGLIVGILIIGPNDIARSDVSGAERSSPAASPPRSSFAPARSPAPVLASQQPPDASGSAAPAQGPQGTAAPTAPASSQSIRPAPARTSSPTIAAPARSVPAASPAATAAPTVPSTQPTPTSAPTSFVPTLPPLPTLPA